MSNNKEKDLEKEVLDEEIDDGIVDGIIDGEEELEEEAISESIEKLKETESQLLRLQADFSNYKKRNEKEREGLVSYGIEQVIADILPVLDNFERALDCEEEEKDGFYEGVEMIYKQLLEVLVKNDVQEIDAVEKPFDPNYHYAVVMEESEDLEEGTVIGVIQKGYIMKEKVIRPAMVRVAQ